MITKLFEVRDEGTCIGALALRLQPENDKQRAILAHAGYGASRVIQQEYIALFNAHTLEGAYDPFKQRSETMRQAHLWVRDHFNNVRDGFILDLRVVRGERVTPVASDIQGVY